MVIVAQSLGCQVISNYLWDAGKHQHIFKDTGNDNSDQTEFLKLKSLKRLVTTGCNIPLFIGGLKKRECFKIPNDDGFVWGNFYDPDDVLGWPLRQLGPTCDFISGHAINAGGLLSSWNPLSHTKYWTDGDMLDPIAGVLHGLLP